MATRQKRLIPNESIGTDTANEYLSKYAIAEAKIRKINAEIDIKLGKIREGYAAQLSSLTEEKDSSFDFLHAFAMQNKADFAKKRSMDFAHGQLGFRTGTPKLKTVKGFTWAAVLNLVKIKLPDYIRTTEEVNKEKFLVDRELDGMADTMKDVGMFVDQEETFFVQPKIEELA